MLQSKIEKELLSARLEKAKGIKNSDIKAETLTLLKASLQNEAINLQKELSDNDVIKIVKSNVKQLNQTLESAEKAQRPELIAKTNFQLQLLSQYLPKPLSEDEIFDALTKDANLSNEMPFGKVMGIAMKTFSGKADGNIVKSAVQKYLA